MTSSYLSQPLRSEGGCALDIFEQRCASEIERQRNTIRFLLANEIRWRTFPSDFDAVSEVCNLVNLGIAEIKGDKIRLLCRQAARRAIA